MYHSNSIQFVNDRHPTRVHALTVTDIEQDPMQIYHYYKLRFQIEFIFSSQTVYGLEDCQTAMFKKLAFHFSTQSLRA